MVEATQIPLYKAKALDGNESFEGGLIRCSLGSFIAVNTHNSCAVWIDESIKYKKIALSTLCVSFDGGITWFKDFERINEILQEAMKK